MNTDTPLTEPTIQPRAGIFRDGAAIVSPHPIPTYAGHLHKEGEDFPGYWAYPFPTIAGAEKALNVILNLRDHS